METLCFLVIMLSGMIGIVLGYSIAAVAMYCCFFLDKEKNKNE